MPDRFEFYIDRCLRDILVALRDFVARERRATARTPWQEAFADEGRVLHYGEVGDNPVPAGVRG